MEIYRYNRACHCARCRCHGLMGPVVVMTVGVLLLFETLNIPHMDFGRTWPLILIAIGVTLFLKRNGSTSGHVQLYPGSPAEPPPMPPPPPIPPSEVSHG